MVESISENIIEFTVSGMRCEACMDSVKRALTEATGVRSVQIDLESGRARVEVGPGLEDPALLDTAVRKAGYQTDILGEALEAKPSAPDASTTTQAQPAEEPPPAEIQRFDYAIQGMTCASCVSKVQAAFASVPGVAEAEVNFATHRARVMAAAHVRTESLSAAVKKAGYVAKPIEIAAEENPAERFAARRHEAEAELVSWKREAIAAGAVSIWILLFGRVAGLVWLHAIAATAIQAYAGRRYYRGAGRALRAASANMDSLIALSTTAAWGYGVFLLLTGGMAAHEFMTATMLFAFISSGKWLEGRGRLGAGRALEALLDLAPAKALRFDGEEPIEVDARELRPGDRCRVLQGERVPADGSLTSPRGEVNEAMMTGESVPVAKSHGDALLGGTVNVSAAFNMVIERVGAETALRRIVERVEEAQNTRPKMQALADRAAAMFVPLVLVIALITVIASILAGLGGGEAVTRAVAVLIVACPCALGLATPLAVMAGVGVAARRGMIVRSAETLEISGKIRRVIFDKTGTLTMGEPEVTAVLAAEDQDEHAVLDAAASLEADSTHPLGAAIVAKARAQGIGPRPLRGLEIVVGSGVRSVEPPLALGSMEFLAEQQVAMGDFAEEASRHQTRGETVVGVGVPGGSMIGLIALADRVKPGAAQAVRELHDLGLKTAMISGDSEATTAAVAQMLKIGSHASRVKPGEKADAVRVVQERGEAVAMVGDGINDAPALAQADLGVAMAGGSDIAQESADIILLGSDPRQVAESISLARAIRTKMIQNLGWAFIYNACLIPLAAFGFLQPIFASAAMAASSVSVVANTLLLYRRGD